MGARTWVGVTDVAGLEEGGAFRVTVSIGEKPVKLRPLCSRGRVTRDRGDGEGRQCMATADRQLGRRDNKMYNKHGEGSRGRGAYTIYWGKEESTKR